MKSPFSREGYGLGVVFLINLRVAYVPTAIMIPFGNSTTEPKNSILGCPVRTI